MSAYDFQTLCMAVAVGIFAIGLASMIIADIRSGFWRRK